MGCIKADVRADWEKTGEWKRLVEAATYAFLSSSSMRVMRTLTDGTQRWPRTRGCSDDAGDQHLFRLAGTVWWRCITFVEFGRSLHMPISASGQRAATRGAPHARTSWCRCRSLPCCCTCSSLPLIAITTRKRAAAKSPMVSASAAPFAFESRSDARVKKQRAHTTTTARAAARRDSCCAATSVRLCSICTVWIRRCITSRAALG